jgi:hypothetical protein
VIENTAPLRKKMLALCNSKLLDQIETLIEDGSYGRAIDAINDLNAEIISASRACSGLATKVVKRHWSPLFEVNS